MSPYISDEQILNAALDVMSKRGYAGATTLQIAAAAGINEVTLFRRFGSKKKLLLAAATHEAEKFNAGDIEYSGHLEADLLSIVHFYQALVESRGQFIAMLLTEVARQPELREVAQMPLAIVNRITAVIGRYQQAGALAAEPPLSAFVALVGPLFLAELLRFMQPDAQEPPSTHQELVHRFLRGRTPECRD